MEKGVESGKIGTLTHVDNGQICFKFILLNKFDQLPLLEKRKTNT